MMGSRSSWTGPWCWFATKKLQEAKATAVERQRMMKKGKTIQSEGLEGFGCVTEERFPRANMRVKQSEMDSPGVKKLRTRAEDKPIRVCQSSMRINSAGRFRGGGVRIRLKSCLSSPPQAVAAKEVMLPNA
mmetsp:Transcript_42651/g.66805  ORF Transcript_42651/g.66805 Transcript_42651/m.66805 type:complete len:131 (+) Transcript_42651:2320-2712(+)